MTKQAYYKWLKNEGRYRKAAQEGFVVEYADEIREKDPGIGGVKIWQMYADKTKDTDAYVGRDRFLDVLREVGKLRGAPIKGVKTTDSKHGLPVYHDLRKELVPSRPDQEWDSDITYIPLDNDQWVYLTTIIDAYTHAVVGWKVAPTLEYEHSLEALEMAINNRKEKVGSLVGLIHHSDRGKQYCSKGYTQRLIKEGIEISMTESGNPKDNPSGKFFILGSFSGNRLIRWEYIAFLLPITSLLSEI